MFEVKIPKEVTKYEAKLVGPFTARQCAALVIMVPAIGLVYTNLSDLINSTAAAFVCMPIGMLGAAFGWYKPYGLAFEVYIRSVFINSFLAPSVRVYKTVNYYDVLTKQVNTLTPEQEFLIDAELAGISEEEIDEGLALIRKKQKKAPKKKKYKVSKKAVF